MTPDRPVCRVYVVVAVACSPRGNPPGASRVKDGDDSGEEDAVERARPTDGRDRRAEAAELVEIHDTAPDHRSDVRQGRG